MGCAGWDIPQKEQSEDGEEDTREHTCVGQVNPVQGILASSLQPGVTVEAGIPQTRPQVRYEANTQGS